MKQGVISRLANETVHNLGDDYRYEIGGLARTLYFLPLSKRPLLAEGVLHVTDRLVVPSLPYT